MSDGRIRIKAGTTPGNGQNIAVTVRVNSPELDFAQEAITVKYVGVDPIATPLGNFLANTRCIDGQAQPPRPGKQRQLGARLIGGADVRMIMKPQFPGSIYQGNSLDGHFCDFFGTYWFTGNLADTGGSGGLTWRVDDESDGLSVRRVRNDRLNNPVIPDANGTHLQVFMTNPPLPFVWQNRTRTFKLVLGINDTAPGAHVTPEFKKTLEVLFTPNINYGALAVVALLKTPDGKNDVTGRLRLNAKVNTGRHHIAKIVHSGGVEGATFRYNEKGIGGGPAPEVDAQGNVYIPANVTGLPGRGRTLVMEVEVEDIGNDAQNTRNGKVGLIVVFVQPEPFVGRALRSLEGGGEPFDYSLVVEGDPVHGLPGDIPVGHARGQGGIPSGGTLSYTYNIVGASDGMNVRSNGEVYLEQGIVARLKPYAVTVRITDFGSTEAGSLLPQESVDVTFSLRYTPFGTAEGQFAPIPTRPLPLRFGGETLAAVALPEYDAFAPLQFFLPPRIITPAPSSAPPVFSSSVPRRANLTLRRSLVFPFPRKRESHPPPLAGGGKNSQSEFLGGGETPPIIGNTPPPATANALAPPPASGGG